MQDWTALPPSGQAKGCVCSEGLAFLQSPGSSGQPWEPGHAHQQPVPSSAAPTDLRWGLSLVPTLVASPR